jgi:F420-0:gamma-glutamyl ligase
VIVTAIKTAKITAGAMTLNKLLDRYLPSFTDGSVLVVTSKVVSLCEGAVLPASGDKAARNELIRQQADLYHEPAMTTEGFMYHFTIKHNTLIPASGIDESNGDGHYILWPKDPVGSANRIRGYLRKRFGVRQAGVTITDSTIGLSRWGTLGIAIGHSGFTPVKNYIGTPDLFGRVLKVCKANIAGGLASAAVLAMGEGAEQTPIAVVSDVPFVEFQDHDPTPEDIASYYVSPLNDDPFLPFFNTADWQKGDSGH